MPKQVENQYSKVEVDSGVHLQNTKQAVKKEFGITDKQAQRYETLAKHKDIVEQAPKQANKSE